MTSDLCTRVPMAILTTAEVDFLNDFLSINFSWTYLPNIPITILPVNVSLWYLPYQWAAEHRNTSINMNFENQLCSKHSLSCSTIICLSHPAAELFFVRTFAVNTYHTSLINATFVYDISCLIVIYSLGLLMEKLYAIDCPSVTSWSWPQDIALSMECWKSQPVHASIFPPSLWFILAMLLF